jgi:hypothetical protein
MTEGAVDSLAAVLTDATEEECATVADPAGNDVDVAVGKDADLATGKPSSSSSFLLRQRRT